MYMLSTDYFAIIYAVNNSQAPANYVAIAAAMGIVQK